VKLSDIADEMVKGLNARTTAMLYFGSKGYPVYADVTFTYDTPALPPCYGFAWDGVKHVPKVQP
jgi:hypothetical protein